MKTIKGPAIFLAQFAGDAAPFNTLDKIAGWAARARLQGRADPVLGSRLFDLDRAATARRIATKSSELSRGTGSADRAFHPSAGTAGRGASGL